MKTHKLKLELPDAADLKPQSRLRYQPLVDAERAAVEAEQARDRRVRELAALDKRVGELPKEITAGHVASSALAEAMRQRDACALLIAPAERAIAKARARVVAEQKGAQTAVDREVTRLYEPYRQAIAQLEPVLLEIKEGVAALEAALSNDAPNVEIDWPASPSAERYRAGQHIMHMTKAGG